MSEEVQDEAGKQSSPSPARASPNACQSVDASTNVSQTQIGQITASSLTTSTEVANKWSCEVCTYENFPLSRKVMYQIY